MLPPWANLLMAFVAFIAGFIVLEINGWLWYAALAVLIAYAIFQSPLVWYLVGLFVVGTFVVGMIVEAIRDPRRQGPSDAEGTGEGSSGSGGMEG